jgi:hypothetical protein
MLWDLLIATDEGSSPVDRRFGFAILAIDCLLIETLAAFRNGFKDTNGKSQEIFLEFLLGRPLFRGHFTRSTAMQFWKEFRCGILHQAEVGGNSKIWSVGELIREESGGLIVNRTKFHQLIKQEITGYCQELLNPARVDLRANFRTKMDFICRRS